MTIREAVADNLAAMKQAGIELHPATVGLDVYGDLEFTKCESRKGRKGAVYTVFATVEGLIAFWPRRQEVGKFVPMKEVDRRRDEQKAFRLANSLVLKPLRTCLYLHHCVLCDKAITAGQTYYDGGYPRRGHESCVKNTLQGEER